MIVDLYIPICLFRVRYEVASGRPFTDLERLLLMALKERNTRASELAARFCLRDAIVIESIVTLAREGWVALNAEDGTYFITSTGRQALTESTMPQFLVVNERNAVILMERVNGGLINGGEATYMRATDFVGGNGPALDHRLEVEWCITRLAGGQVESFLPKPKDQWVRRVDTPQLAGIDAYWVKVLVNTANGTISFARPIPWEASLRPALLRKAETVSGVPIQIAPDITVETVPTCAWHDIQVELSDLWLDCELHACAFRRALDHAETFVHVASAFFDPAVLEGSIRSALIAALNRGVKVGILWGYEQGERAKRTTDWLKKLAYDAGERGSGLWFNTDASDSHAKILSWDEKGQKHVVVGSCNWLSNPELVTERTRINISVCLRDGEIVAEILRAFAGLWLQTGSQDWYPAAEDLFDHAANLSSGLASPGHRELLPTNASVRIVCDSDHEREMRGLLLNAQSRCWIASHKMASNASARLASLFHPKQSLDLESQVTYEELSHETTPIAELNEQVRQGGGLLIKSDHFHGKCIVADDVAFVSSFNFLSASPFGSGRTAREIGLIIRNKEIADLLWRQAVWFRTDA